MKSRAGNSAAFFLRLDGDCFPFSRLRENNGPAPRRRRCPKRMKALLLLAFGFWLLALGFWLWALGFGFGLWVWALGFGLWALGFGLQAAGCKFQLTAAFDHPFSRLRGKVPEGRMGGLSLLLLLCCCCCAATALQPESKLPSPQPLSRKQERGFKPSAKHNHVKSVITAFRYAPRSRNRAYHAARCGNSGRWIGISNHA
ncbi:hypothetical protein D3C81_442750 [compost metagenome]